MFDELQHAIRRLDRPKRVVLAGLWAMAGSSSIWVAVWDSSALNIIAAALIVAGIPVIFGLVELVDRLLSDEMAERFTKWATKRPKRSSSE
jgi:hypothetical protein